MAQVMKYFEHPTTYNWSNMPANYGTTTTANFINDIHNEISTMYDGVPNPLSYYCNSTGVSSGANMGSVLRHDFNYTSADWSNYYYPTVVNNIDNGKPVILSGSNSSSGHMWVCDGYKDIDYYFEDCTGIGYLYLHMNWSWNTAYTNYNGWFAFNNFNPINSYNSNKKMIYNITP